MYICIYTYTFIYNICVWVFEYMEYHYTFFTLAKIQKKLIVTNAGEDAEKLELSFIAGGNEKHYSHFGR